MRGARPAANLERALETCGVIAPGERVLVACSGGPDSVALAAALQGVARRMRLAIYAAHVNHGLRASAWQDECVALDLAARCEIPVEVLALQGPQTDEQSLRRARYRALARAAERRGCQVVATAHHAEDQSETVLLALLRGAGPEGLRGIRSRRRLEGGIDLARPLIGIPPERLRAYCHTRAMPYAVDPSNAARAIRRNAVREALAALRPLFPGLDAAIARAAELVAAEHEVAPRAVLRRSIREQLANEDELRDVDFTHIEAAVRALEDGRTGTFHMKPGIAMRIERGAVQGINKE